MGERKELRRKVLLGLLSYPLALIPTLGGATALLGGWATGIGGELGMATGAMVMLVGVGVYATRWLFGMDSLTKEALEEIQGAALNQHEAKLDDLDDRLQADSDWRSEKLLRQLRRVSKAIRSKGLSAKMNPASRIEISMQVDQLFGECVKTLEESLVLWERAKTVLSPENKAAILVERESQINEVSECVGVLERIYSEGFETNKAQASSSELSRIRQELDQSLAVARRVEERMHTLERGIPDSLGETE